jgi:hypothetical protein
VRALYVLGSHAEGTAVPLSDLDLLVVLDAPLAPAAQVAAEALRAELAAECPVRLDLLWRGADELAGLHAVLQQSLRSGSRLAYGDDVAATLPPVDHAAFCRAAWDGALHFCLNILRGVVWAGTPLACPEPGDEFCGYARKRIDDWYPAAQTQGTKELVAAASRLATALIATLAGQRAGGKTEAFRLYAAAVGGPWAGWLSAVFEQCKLRWHYAVPTAAAEREALRALCGRMADFENDALGVYGEFRAQQAAGDAGGRAWAAAREGQIVSRV